MTEQVLYRKYRPKNFDEVAGQDHLVKILKNALKSDRIAHAYLFSGPRGTGKTSVARILARAVNCANLAKISEGNFDAKLSIGRSPRLAGASGEAQAGEGGLSAPCNNCSACTEFLSGQTLNLVEMDAASNRGIDEIRLIRDSSAFLPSSRYKVYIIDEVHMLTKEAFNALLKTLEEPPGHVIFILATTEPEKVPETISSRCQHLRFRLIADELISKMMIDAAGKEGLGLEPEAAQVLSFFAEGSLRDAFNFLGQVAVGSGPKITASDLRDFFGAPAPELVGEITDAIFKKDASLALAALAKTKNSGIDPRLFLKILIKDFRDLFLDSLKPGFSTANPKFSADELERILKIFLEAFNTRFYSPHRELPLELALFRIIKE
ncbi:MAG: DNA polymerase III subunit gamma/tau [Patescibacteria group bacterium]